jgi:hypothetical protein
MGRRMPGSDAWPRSAPQSGAETGSGIRRTRGTEIDLETFAAARAGVPLVRSHVVVVGGGSGQSSPHGSVRGGSGHSSPHGSACGGSGGSTAHGSVGGANARAIDPVFRSESSREILRCAFPCLSRGQSHTGDARTRTRCGLTASAAPARGRRGSRSRSGACGISRSRLGESAPRKGGHPPNHDRSIPWNRDRAIARTDSPTALTGGSDVGYCVCTTSSVMRYSPSSQAMISRAPGWSSPA